MTAETPLGRATDYPEHYSPGLLYAIARTDSRTALGLGGDLPFHGGDIWNAWELSWLGPAGMPQTAAAVICVPAGSPSIFESKSLKLYLNSFAMTKFDSGGDVAAAIRKDLSSCAGSDIDVRLWSPGTTAGLDIAALPGNCLDDLEVVCDSYEVCSDYLESDPDDIVREELFSHLLRSLCPVTGQPDIGSVLIRYTGPRIGRDGLLRYIVSYRQHEDFHEACVERMFVDILERCKPEQLTVCARYQRRGGIDINPFRSNFETEPPNLRLWRQ